MEVLTLIPTRKFISGNLLAEKRAAIMAYKASAFCGFSAHKTCYVLLL